MKEWYQKYKLLLPVLILTGFSVYTLLDFLFGVLVLSLYHKLGFAACAICLLSFFMMPRNFKYLLGVTLILGLFNFLNFTPSTYTYGFSLNNLNATFQPLSLVVGILTLLLLIKKRKDLVTINSSPATTIHQDQYAGSVEKFRMKFADKTDAELRELIADKRFTPAAKEAAQQLLNERQDQAKE